MLQRVVWDRGSATVTSSVHEKVGLRMCTYLYSKQRVRSERVGLVGPYTRKRNKSVNQGVVSGTPRTLWNLRNEKK